MHEFSSSINKVNKAVTKVRTIGERLPLNKRFKGCERFDNGFSGGEKK